MSLLARRDLPRADPVLDSTTKSYWCVASSCGALTSAVSVTLFQKKRAQDKCEIKSVLWTCHWCARMAKDTRAMEIYLWVFFISPCLTGCHAESPGHELNDNRFYRMSEPCASGAGTSHNALIKLAVDRFVALGSLAGTCPSLLVNWSNLELF